MRWIHTLCYLDAEDSKRHTQKPRPLSHQATIQGAQQVHHRLMNWLITRRRIPPVRRHLIEPPRIARAYTTSRTRFRGAKTPGRCRRPTSACHLAAINQPRPGRVGSPPPPLGRRAMKSISTVVKDKMHQLDAASELTMQGQDKIWKCVYGCIYVLT